MPSEFLNPSLGLSAFSLLMWVTLPWAFLDKVTTYRQRQWLNASSRLFFGSGIWFAITAILDTTGVASNVVVIGNSTALSPSAYAVAQVEALNVFLAPFFLAGTIPLILGVVTGFYVVESISGLGGVGRVTVLGATMEMSVILILFFVAGFDGVFLYVLRLIVQPVFISGSPFLFFIASLVVSLISSLITFGLLLVERTRAAGYVMAFLVASPIWVLIILGLLLEAKLIHL